MGRFIAVLAIVGAAAFAAHPGAGARARSAPVAPAAVTAQDAEDAQDALVAAERDLAVREAELGLIGSAPLFGAEGLPKPTR